RAAAALLRGRGPRAQGDLGDQEAHRSPRGYDPRALDRSARRHHRRAADRVPGRAHQRARIPRRRGSPRQGLMFAAVSERTLVLAPRGRDAELTRQLLESRALLVEICASGGELLAALASDAGCAIVTEEALVDGFHRELVRVLRDQPPWSDFPLLLLSGGYSSRLQQILPELGNVTLL